MSSRAPLRWSTSILLIQQVVCTLTRMILSLSLETSTPVKGTQDIAFVIIAVCMTIAPHHAHFSFVHIGNRERAALNCRCALVSSCGCGSCGSLRYILLSCLFSFFLCNISVCQVKFDLIICVLFESHCGVTLFQLWTGNCIFGWVTGGDSWLLTCMSAWKRTMPRFGSKICRFGFLNLWALIGTNLWLKGQGKEQRPSYIFGVQVRMFIGMRGPENKIELSLASPRGSVCNHHNTRASCETLFLQIMKFVG